MGVDKRSITDPLSAVMLPPSKGKGYQDYLICYVENKSCGSSMPDTRSIVAVGKILDPFLKENLGKFIAR